MRILVTGGAGFIGSHLADLLLEQGHEVVAFDSLEEQVHPGRLRPGYLSDGVELIVGDVRDREAVVSAIRNVDVVFHLAAAVGVGQSMYELERYTSVNSLGTASLLQAIVDTRRDLAKLIVASSMSIYGEGLYRCDLHGEVAPGLRSEKQLARREWEPKCPVCGSAVSPLPTPESKPLIPTSLYAITKRDQEEMCLTTASAYRFASIAVRFFNVYGTRQALSNPYTGVAAIFASRLLNGNPPIVFEDGRQTRDFTHVSDIVRACAALLNTDAADGLALNVGRGDPVSVVTIAQTLATGLGVDVEPEVLGRYRAGDIRHCFADVTRQRELLGFQPLIELRQGLEELAGWLETQTADDYVDEATGILQSRGLSR
jgi:dTDP-L-rhamnose 4-epimerase